ncbi:hypothetical protein LSH36_266g04051 [Paralvinella palmiformis]|uniref:Integrase zinc-binding domain-containing protein n=1 Tax=Paralvinella palmiformis TaxID=53620 RepID=A0AAD9N4B4_9ANNE|nr:hypothetical protein LSH36_266g04051 [Paralvinella palmiformis]
MYIAGTLSRAYIIDNNPQSKSELRIHSITERFPVIPAKLQVLKTAYHGDEHFIHLKRYIAHGWPKYRSNISPQLYAYWNVRDEIHLEDNLLFVGERLIIPASIRNELLQQLHEGHFGIEKCRSSARDILYWPNMMKDISNVVAKCCYK